MECEEGDQISGILEIYFWEAYYKQFTFKNIFVMLEVSGERTQDLTIYK